MSSPGDTMDRPPSPPCEGDLAVVSGNEVGGLVRRLRRRQDLSRRQLSDRVRRASGDPAMNPDRLRRWEVGRDVPEAYWRGWLAMALGVPRDVLDRAAMITDGRRRSKRRVQAAGRDRSVQAGHPEHTPEHTEE